MTDRRLTHGTSILVRGDQPLIGVILPGDGPEVTCYFTDDAVADAATSQDDLQAALAAIGAFSDLDFDEMMDDLERIRHQSKPTPPIDLDL